MKIKIISIILLIIFLSQLIFPVTVQFAQEIEENIQIENTEINDEIVEEHDINNLGEPIDEDNTPLVTFNSMFLKQKVAESCDQNNDGEVSEKEISSLTFLYFSNYYDVVDLTGLEKATNLQMIIIYSSVSNINALKNLENITSLTINSMFGSVNGIADLEQFADFACLSKLTNLDLSNNNLKNLNGCEDVLENAPSLTALRLDNNPIEDLTGYATLKSTYPALTINTIRINNDIGTVDKDSVNTIQIPLAFFQLKDDPNNTDKYNFYCSIDDFEINNYNINNRTVTINTENIGYNNFYFSFTPKDSISGLTSIYFDVYYLVEYPGGNTTQTIEFDDYGLNYLINEFCDYDNDGKITEHDLLNITNLSVYDSEEPDCYCIKDLSGIEQMVNLRALELPYQQISDISIISELPNLEYVNFSNNYITDISVLNNLDLNFGNISLNENFIDLDNQDNWNLYYTYCMNHKENNNVSSNMILNYLAKLGSSQKLGNPADFDNPVIFNDNNIKAKLIDSGADLNSDGVLTRRELYDATHIAYDYSDPSSITEITVLKDLDLSDMNITDLTGIEYLTNLCSIDLSGNPIQNFAPLKKLLQLQFLNLSNTGLNNINVLSTKMTGGFRYYDDGFGLNIDLSDNDIDDISGFANWLCYSTCNPDEGLSLSNRNITLLLSNNRIDDIEVLKDFKTLKYVDLSNNLIEDISPLKDYDFQLNNFESLVAIGFYSEAELEYLREMYNEEMLNQFDGINLLNNPIDFTSQDTLDVIELFAQKEVDLLLARFGDINGDGSVTLFDAFTILKRVISNIQFSQGDLYIVDYNGDGSITLFDAFSILKMVILG